MCMWKVTKSQYTLDQSKIRHRYEARGYEAEAKPKHWSNHEAEAEALNFWKHKAEAEAFSKHEAQVLPSYHKYPFLTLFTCLFLIRAKCTGKHDLKVKNVEFMKCKICLWGYEAEAEAEAEPEAEPKALGF